MCRTCWKQFGQPRIENEAVLRAVAKIAEVYGLSMVGGNLHSQLDDWNIEDRHWEEFKIWHEGTPDEQVEVEKDCFKLMGAMSVEERASALAIYHEIRADP